MSPRLARLPIFYGWIIVAVAFVTMAIGVNARTAFSLLFPPILGEFGWDRGVVAGIFSFGFFVSALVAPFVGRLVDRLVTIDEGLPSRTVPLEVLPFSPTRARIRAEHRQALGVQQQMIEHWLEACADANTTGSGPTAMTRS